MGRAFQNRKLSMAKTAGMKTKIYSKYGKEIYVCAKSSGTDPDGNLTLRRLIEKAKKDQVPTHVIDRAIEKAFKKLGSALKKAENRDRVFEFGDLCQEAFAFHDDMIDAIGKATMEISAETKVPLSFMGEYYNLQLHLNHVKERLEKTA